MEKLVLAPYPFRTMEMIFWPEDLERLRSIVEIVWGTDEPLSEQAAEELKRDATYIACCRWIFGAVDEESAPQLRAIAELGGGHWGSDKLDYRACFRRNIRVLSCSPAFADAVAEMALAHALAALREVVDSDRAMRQGREQFGKQKVRTLFGAQVGMVGYGNLARSLQPLLVPFNCGLQAYDPWLPDSHLLDQGVTPASLDTLLETSDVIFILAASNPENRAMLSRDKLKKVKEGAVIVLMSRAHVVDFDALLDLAEEGRFTATTDVYPEEPPASDHRVRRSVNTILTPHLAGAADHGRRNIGRLLLKDIEAMNLGLPPMYMKIAQPEIILRGQS